MFVCVCVCVCVWGGGVSVCVCVRSRYFVPHIAVLMLYYKSN